MNTLTSPMPPVARTDRTTLLIAMFGSLLPLRVVRQSTDSQPWSVRANDRRSENPVTPEVSGSSPVAPVSSHPAHGVGHVQHAIAFDDLRVLEHLSRSGKKSKNPPSGPKKRPDHAEMDLVDQAGLEGLPADVAGRHRHVAVTGERAGLARSRWRRRR